MYFESDTTILIGDTTCTGFVDPNWYIAQEGRVRELALCRYVSSALADMSKGDVPITRDAFVAIHREARLFEPIKCWLAFGSARQSSIKLVFEFRDIDHALVASGGQTIAFADSKHRLIRIPGLWRQFAEKFSMAPKLVERSPRDDVFSVPGYRSGDPAFSWAYRAVLMAA